MFTYASLFSGLHILNVPVVVTAINFLLGTRGPRIVQDYRPKCGAELNSCALCSC